MRTLVAIPCMDQVPAMFCKSVLGMRAVGETEYSFTLGSLIYDARNKLAEKAINEGFDRVLWLDSDMMFETDMMERLHARMDEGYEFVTGLYITRKRPYKPVIFKELAVHEVDGKFYPEAVTYSDYPYESFFEIAATGLGCTMVTVRLLKAIHEKMGLPFSPVMGFGEDLSFAMRCHEMGVRMYCDSSIKATHIGYCNVTEDTFFWEKSQMLGEQKNEGRQTGTGGSD